MTSAISDAFEIVTRCPSFHNRWILDEDFARIINREYKVPPELELIPKELNKALGSDNRYKTASQSAGNGKGTFRRDQKPKKLPGGKPNKRRLYFYYVTNKASISKDEMEKKWRKNFKLEDVSGPPICAVEESARQKFLSALRQSHAKSVGKDAKAGNVDASFSLQKVDVGSASLDSVKVGETELRTPIKTKKNKETKKPTPRTGGVHQAHPKLARKSLPLADDGKAQVRWEKPIPKDITDRAMRDKVNAMLKHLVVVAENNPLTARKIVDGLTRRMAIIKGFDDPNVAERNKEMDKTIVDGIANFVREKTARPSSAGGTIPQRSLNVLDTLAAAVAYKNEVSPSQLSVRTGIGRRIFNNNRKRSLDTTWTETLFEPAQRKRRKDCVIDLVVNCVGQWCHTEDASRVDTESKQVYTVRDHRTGEKEKHPKRVWNDLSIEQRYKAFCESDAYREFQDANNATIGIERFRTGVCNCVRDPSEDSCVDLLTNGLDHYLTALRNALSRPNIRRRMAECSCVAHVACRRAREQGLETDDKIEELLKCRYRHIVKATSCTPVEEPLLRNNEDETPPKHIPWRCTHGVCTQCGIDMLLLWECGALTNSTDKIPVKEWRLAPRAGTNQKGEQNTQLELTDDEVECKEVMIRLREQLSKCRKHYNEKSWIARARNIDMNTFGEKELIVLTDFSATVDLRASATDNSSVDAHAVLDVFVVLHSPRYVFTVKPDGSTLRVRVHDCDVWYFFGDTISKGKKNDHVFHNACLRHIVSFYKDELEEKRNICLDHVKLWTDNCSGQYKCQQNFFQIATFPSRIEGVRITHRFAQKYDFKGPWDAAGKVAKERIRKEEYTTKKEGGNRCPNALVAYKKLSPILGGVVDRKNWASLEEEKDWRLSTKGLFEVRRRFVGFGTENYDEYSLLRNDRHKHVVFTDRENVQQMRPIKNTQQLHEVAGFHEPRETNQEQWKMCVSKMPCSCLACRKVVRQDCPFSNIRQSKELWVSEKKEDAEAAARRAELASKFNVYNHRLVEHFGKSPITIPMMTDELKKFGLTYTGLKWEIAKRLVEYVENNTAAEAQTVEPQMPLAITAGITTEQDMEVQEDEEEALEGMEIA